ncbi:hypothetical protein PKF05_10810 [Fusobacterium simiae]|uniref:hypothetical protein n=1 Tax=Fusobacterium simiae TaxID=855 RepID=UPI0020C4FFFB|nr:hypothetical protein [Fusobacterium simiae]MDC7956316.1 hypothetical protein [Fusobacterium simiae]
MDPYIPLWLYFGKDTQQIESFNISDFKKNILVVKKNFCTNEIYEICLIFCNKVIFSNKILDYNKKNIRKFEGIPQIYDKNNKLNSGKEIYNNFRIFYSRDSIKIEFTNIVNNYPRILKKMIKNKDIYFETNKNGVILSIFLSNLPAKIIKNMLKILKVKSLLEFSEECNEKNEYTLLEEPLKNQRF